MKSLHTLGVTCLMCILTAAANAQGQGITALSSPSFPNPQFSHLTVGPVANPYARTPGYGTPGYGTPSYGTPSYGAPSYGASQVFAAQPYVQTNAIPAAAPAATASSAAVLPRYTPYATATPPMNAYPQRNAIYSTPAVGQPGTMYAAPVVAQPGHYANYALPQTWPYSQPQPTYWPTSTGEASVMRHNGTLLGGPPLTQPLQQKPQQPAAPARGAEMGSTLGYQPGSNYGCQVGPGYGYAPMQGQLWTDAYANGYADRCVSYAPPRQRNWFASASGLIMNRDHGNHHTFSFGTLAEEDQRTNTRDAAMQWSGGYEVRFGRYFNCRRNAISAVYWGISPDRQSTRTVSADVAGNLNAILNFADLDYGGVSADNFVNVAPGVDGIHALEREFEFHNIELNVWQFCTSCGGGACGCSRFRFNWMAGIRYFVFNENLLFGSDANDTQLTFENDEIYYNIDVENSLLGFQLGNELEYCLSRRCTLDMGLKLGIYGNKIDHVSEIGGAQGIATINNGPFVGRDFFVDSNKTDVAFLGEAQVGLEYCINNCWTAGFGYRAFAVTGVALPSEQIYPDLRGINDVELIDSNGSLILHGGYARLEYNW